MQFIRSINSKRLTVQHTPVEVRASLVPMQTNVQRRWEEVWLDGVGHTLDEGDRMRSGCFCCLIFFKQQPSSTGFRLVVDQIQSLFAAFLHFGSAYHYRRLKRNFFPDTLLFEPLSQSLASSGYNANCACILVITLYVVFSSIEVFLSGSAPDELISALPKKKGSSKGGGDGDNLKQTLSDLGVSLDIAPLNFDVYVQYRDYGAFLCAMESLTGRLLTHVSLHFCVLVLLKVFN